MRRFIPRHVVAALVLTAWLGPARADVFVDAAVTPHLVDGSWALGLFLAAFGAYLIRSGISYWRTAEAMSGWPVVDAKVIESRVETRLIEGGDEPFVARYIPQVRYSYTADGAAREGATIRIGLADVGYTSERQAREHAGRYPAGARIAVRYDPSNPAMSVIETGQVGGVKKIVGGAITLAVGLAVFVLTIWTGGPEAR
jgi:hypothetical protein